MSSVKTPRADEQIAFREEDQHPHRVLQDTQSDCKRHATHKDRGFKGAQK